MESSEPIRPPISQPESDAPKKDTPLKKPPVEKSTTPKDIKSILDTEGVSGIVNELKKIGWDQKEIDAYMINESNTDPATYHEPVYKPSEYDGPPDLMLKKYIDQRRKDLYQAMNQEMGVGKEHFALIRIKSEIQNLPSQITQSQDETERLSMQKYLEKLTDMMSEWDGLDYAHRPPIDNGSLFEQKPTIEKFFLERQEILAKRIGDHLTVMGKPTPSDHFSNDVVGMSVLRDTWHYMTLTKIIPAINPRNAL